VPVLLLILVLALPAGALAKGAASASAKAAPVQGVVTQVLDGDSVRFTPPGQSPFTVRLADIEAPEPCQPWGAEAKAALETLVLNKPARLQPTGRDSQGRTVGTLWVDDMPVARRLVEDGHVWSLRWRYDQGPLVKQERVAKSLGRGLHASTGAQNPREWRRIHGPCKADALAAPRR
jgi:endonuclease YncB( thermonuclease family)